MCSKRPFFSFLFPERKLTDYRIPNFPHMTVVDGHLDFLPLLPIPDLFSLFFRVGRGQGGGTGGGRGGWFCVVLLYLSLLLHTFRFQLQGDAPLIRAVGMLIT